MLYSVSLPCSKDEISRLSGLNEASHIEVVLLIFLDIPFWYSRPLGLYDHMYIYKGIIPSAFADPSSLQ